MELLTSIQLIVTPIVALATVFLAYLQVNRLFRLNRRKIRLELVGFLDKIDYVSENSARNFINAEIFQIYFDLPKPLPIHHVNLILNCFDPSRAAFVYSKFPRLMGFSGKAVTRSDDYQKRINDLKKLIYSQFFLLFIIFIASYASTLMVSDLASRWIATIFFLISASIAFSQFSRVLTLLNEISFVESFYKDQDRFNAVSAN